MDLSKRVFGSNIDPKIQKYLSDLQRGGFDVEYKRCNKFDGNISIKDSRG